MYIYAFLLLLLLFSLGCFIGMLQVQGVQFVAAQRHLLHGQRRILLPLVYKLPFFVFFPFLSINFFLTVNFIISFMLPYAVVPPGPHYEVGRTQKQTAMCIEPTRDLSHSFLLFSPFFPPRVQQRLRFMRAVAATQRILGPRRRPLRRPSPLQSLVASRASRRRSPPR